LVGLPDPQKNQTQALTRKMSKNDMELVQVSEGAPQAIGESESQAATAPKKTKPKVLSTFELWSHIAIYFSLFVCAFFFVGAIVAYFVFDRNFRERVNAIDNV
jgi:hypothetical protein